MQTQRSTSQGAQDIPSPLTPPAINTQFVQALDKLVAVARQGQPPTSEYFNPPDHWLTARLRILQDLPTEEQQRILDEAQQIEEEATKANAAGKAATRAWPDVVVRLDTGGLAFFSQLGVVRRPDLTQYFIDSFTPNRDAVVFSEENQALFDQVFRHITKYMRDHFAAGDAVLQSDRQICDAPGRSFHARQLVFGTRYLQLPIMWRQLTFDLPQEQQNQPPDIVEVSIPHWLEDLGLPEELKRRVKEAGITQLVFKAPTKGLSLHLGFDYVGEHKMGPLSIAMFQVKQTKGLAVQGALSTARVKTLSGAIKNTALLTVGPSLHGKSTLTIMIELANSELARQLGLVSDGDEGVYPMNDDIVLLQPLNTPITTMRNGQHVKISHGIDGTENNLYAMPYGLNSQDDPITYEVVRGTKDAPNPQETLENVPVNPADGVPDFQQNPVRNMRLILSRPRLVARKSAQKVIEAITSGQLKESVHVPMEHTDRVFWQAVMRQNTVVPPLRRLSPEQYIRVLMYGEAVQMGAATGAIGRPYVEYFSDPFIIGLEDDNANILYHVLQEMARGGLPLEFYVFNTGGIGADTNDEASGALYKKIPRELTLMLQEALLREAVKFEYDPVLGSDVAVAIINGQGQEIANLRHEWLPRMIYGEEEYTQRVIELKRRRYYGKDSKDKAGILRYTKVADQLVNPSDIPPPTTEREFSWLLSFCWHVDQAYDALPVLLRHRGEGKQPPADRAKAVQQMYNTAKSQGLTLSQESRHALESLGLKP